MTETVFFTLLDLINDFASTFASGDFALDLTVLLGLNVLEAFNLHHGIKVFLFANPLFFEVLIFCKLLVTNSEYL